MEWYQYLAAFFSGALLANVVPHFVHGVSGNKFPTPFSKPHGIGLSSPTVNVVWALANMVIGYLLLKEGRVIDGGAIPLVVAFVGASAISIMASIRFQQKHKE